jgi:polar amino acid transport system substrate-binding protein
MIDLALASGATDRGVSRADENLVAITEGFTNGFGFDSVIITAAAPGNNDPIELSAEILRKKGKVIVVGAVKMDVPREPHFYRKELELRMSCSYGPGRYDYQYEEKGHDYPYGYVRWTEQRNMEAFLQLIARGAVKLKELITHVFDIEEAEKAYDLVLGKNDSPSIGILLKYREGSAKDRKAIAVNSFKREKLNVAFIGAGSFAQSYLIPSVKNFGASLDTVVTSTGISAKNVATKFGFNKADTEPREVFESKDLSTIFVATRHNSHAAYVIQSLQAGKNVFVEKPLALTLDELNSINEAYASNPNLRLMVGFNRRFSPSAIKVKTFFQTLNEPLLINYRINAGFIPKDHWTQDASVGGGRILGEVCHFIDLMQFLTGADPINVYADCIAFDSNERTNQDNLSVTIRFSNGSVGNLVYVANGSNGVAKERIEVSAGGKTAIVDDFRKVTIYGENKNSVEKLEGKGHHEEVNAFLQSVQLGTPSPISFSSIYLTTLTTFKIVDSLVTGFSQTILPE